MRGRRTLLVEVHLLRKAVHALKQRKEGTPNFSAGVPYGTTRYRDIALSPIPKNTPPRHSQTPRAYPLQQHACPAQKHQRTNDSSTIRVE